MFSNKKLIAAVSLVSFLATSVPAVVSAQSSARTGLGSAFCSNLGTRQSNVGNRIATIAGNIQSMRNTREANRSNLWSTDDQNLSNIRNAQAATRQQRFAELDAKATTTAEQAAVKSFESAVDAAVTARESAVDAAIKAYQNGVDSLLSAYGTTLSVAAVAFASSVDTAFTAAEGGCSSGESVSGIQSTLQSALESARATFKSARNPSSLLSQRQQLAATRKSAIDAAVSAFRTTVQQTSLALKAAFGEHQATSAQ